MSPIKLLAVPIIGMETRYGSSHHARLGQQVFDHHVCLTYIFSILDITLNLPQCLVTEGLLLLAAPHQGGLACPVPNHGVWHHRDLGEGVSEGDLHCEIETDKATMGFENSEEGY